MIAQNTNYRARRRSLRPDQTTYVVDGLVGDRRRQDITADVDANMRSGRAFLDFDHDAPDVVACTDAHFSLTSFQKMKVQSLSQVVRIAERLGIFNTVNDGAQ